MTFLLNLPWSQVHHRSGHARQCHQTEKVCQQCAAQRHSVSYSDKKERKGLIIAKLLSFKLLGLLHREEIAERDRTGVGRISWTFFG